MDDVLIDEKYTENWREIDKIELGFLELIKNKSENLEPAISNLQFYNLKFLEAKF